ncbi:hypothetical protein BCR33DRAFT_766523 [Rhizoclosmatium globosum]|uniref:F-box domain-containing protein n=1 Tax=Rhizoclosmatium globosum TaxID=329046 RepID=A0A1Y2C8B2_9FUNG|nr:hypothetical protein BCR33DRAFT_766523 [Rhizoclosmatium globosum]|eukprot:ORY43271.1 hypothetical protein BCR33DRAFT_766523 [Rhizoclosmatium globosum]
MPSSITNLPPELLLQILLYLQPHYTPTNTAFNIPAGTRHQTFTLTHPSNTSTTPHNYNPPPQPHLHPRPEKPRFHETIHTTKGTHHPTHTIPVLLAFGAVSRVFRTASNLHPFWTLWRWHHLLPLPTTGNTPLPRKFLARMRRDKARAGRIVKGFWFVFGKGGWSVGVEDLGRVVGAGRVGGGGVERVYLDAGWDVVSDVGVLKVLSVLMGSGVEGLGGGGGGGLKELSVIGRGGVGGSVLHGMTSASLRGFLGCRLVRLRVTGYGVNSFSMKALGEVVEGCKERLRELCVVGGVRGGLDLSSLGRSVGNKLKVLSVGFSFVGMREAGDYDEESVYGMAESQMVGWVPVVLGNLSAFTELESLSFSDKGEWNSNRVLEDFPVHILRRLLDSAGPATQGSAVVESMSDRNYRCILRV